MLVLWSGVCIPLKADGVCKGVEAETDSGTCLIDSQHTLTFLHNPFFQTRALDARKGLVRISLTAACWVSRGIVGHFHSSLLMTYLWYLIYRAKAETQQSEVARSRSVVATSAKTTQFFRDSGLLIYEPRLLHSPHPLPSRICIKSLEAHNYCTPRSNLQYNTDRITHPWLIHGCQNDGLFRILNTACSSNSHDMTDLPPGNPYRETSPQLNVRGR